MDTSVNIDVISHIHLHTHTHTHTHSIHRAALWILGEYCTSVEDISKVVTEIRTALGEVNNCIIIV